ncbi:hypothetical protein GCM10007860_00770 [Chitiniphilus shinanonensis]|uniref:Uncharacterized protein n=1 Tax=Chitiniphilus shinanonensis TaxID=553088 RepID=A0ABQ6BSZ6_9NEIS|nr:hypothetical protein [Chitiniphilus shinanonensis]GLS02934.1 hypothetical protein GCM10007860_00770 [Chitiniphilus shinanonensis]
MMPRSPEQPFPPFAIQHGDVAISASFKWLRRVPHRKWLGLVDAPIELPLPPLPEQAIAGSYAWPAGRRAGEARAVNIYSAYLDEPGHAELFNRYLDALQGLRARLSPRDFAQWRAHMAGWEIEILVRDPDAPRGMRLCEFNGLELHDLDLAADRLARLPYQAEEVPLVFPPDDQDADVEAAWALFGEHGYATPDRIVIDYLDYGDPDDGATHRVAIDRDWFVAAFGHVAHRIVAQMQRVAEATAGDATH